LIERNEQVGEGRRGILGRGGKVKRGQQKKNPRGLWKGKWWAAWIMIDYQKKKERREQTQKQRGLWVYTPAVQGNLSMFKIKTKNSLGQKKGPAPGIAQVKGTGKFESQVEL